MKLYTENPLLSKSTLSIGSIELAPVRSNSSIYDLSHVNKGMYFIKADSDIFKLIVIEREKMILN